ncbi:nuclear transport factor 2 family protein [Allomuricauda sp. M10]|uniref:nuclear transport factor 2 family protein n=1 Tax=Allomuricauda sp. M10 TaxID=2683292 RepID=UPI001D189F71|nr:nuclear transport factor 2 family protein [Muricauda sp. M10]
MKNSLVFLFFLCLGICSAQESHVTVSNEVLENIKKDVWTPFMEAYDQLDSEKIKSIHTIDIVRHMVDQNKIETGKDYLENFGGFLESVRDRGNTLGIAFAILNTAINETEDVAFQSGYYQLSSQNKGDTSLVVRGYGYFNVGLRKENGTWRIWMDSDKRTDISKDDFNKCEIIYKL